MADTIKEVLTELNDKARAERASCTDRGNWEGYNFAYEKLEAQALAEIKRIVSEAKPEYECGYPVAFVDGYNDAIDQYHTNLTKALGE